MKQKFNKIFLISLLIIGIVLSSTAVLAQNGELPDLLPEENIDNPSDIIDISLLVDNSSEINEEPIENTNEVGDISADDQIIDDSVLNDTNNGELTSNYNKEDIDPSAAETNNIIIPVENEEAIDTSNDDKNGLDSADDKKDPGENASYSNGDVDNAIDVNDKKIEEDTKREEIKDNTESNDAIDANDKKMEEDVNHEEIKDNTESNDTIDANDKKIGEVDKAEDIKDNKESNATIEINDKKAEENESKEEVKDNTEEIIKNITEEKNNSQKNDNINQNNISKEDGNKETVGDIKDDESGQEDINKEQAQPDNMGAQNSIDKTENTAEISDTNTANENAAAHGQYAQEIQEVQDTQDIQSAESQQDVKSVETYIQDQQNPVQEQQSRVQEQQVADITNSGANEPAAQIPVIEEQNAQPLGFVNILVINSSYGPIPGASVSISQGSGVTNVGGWTTITVPAGDYIFVAQAEGYSPSVGNVTIYPGSVSSATAVLTPASQQNYNGQSPTYNASFVIKNQIGEGQPVVNAVVETDGKTAISNAGGVAVLTGLAPGLYQVKIGGPEYYDSLFTILIVNADITLDAVITKTESAIAASSIVADLYQPQPEPASQHPSDNSYNSGSGSSKSSNKESGSNKGNKGSGAESSNKSSNNQGTEVSGKIKENSNKNDNEDSEIIESGELKPENSATPSPKPTKTPAATPTPEPKPEDQYTVSFNLTNLNGTSVADMIVELHSEVMTGQTDEQGFVTFENVPAGDHNLYLLDENGEVIASKAFSINGGVKTELDIANVGGDKIYVGMGADAVTVDAVVDGSLMAFTSVTEGTNPKTAPLPTQAPESAEDNNLIWMLLISISAAVIAIIILLLAIRKMKKAKALDIHANGNGGATMPIESVDSKEVKRKFKQK